MQDTLPGRTLTESRLSADGGKSAAMAIGYQLLARYIHDSGIEDMAILGVTIPAPPRAHMQPVTGGTDEERKARIDAFAARHGITAGPCDADGTYRAVLKFGPVHYVAYMIPDRTMAERLEILHRAVAEREAAA